jgi:cardiolipin synthase
MGLPRRTGEDRILTVPNAVTVLRLACIPVFVWLVARPDRVGWYPAGLLLAGLGVTDGVDGYVARHFNQVSTVGKVLDPLADRLMLGVAAITTIAVGAVPLWVGLIAIAREVFVAIGFVYVAAAGGRRMDVQLVGKAATFALMVALPLFLGGHANDDWHRIGEDLAWVFAIPGLVLGWYAAFTYIPKGRQEVAAGRRARLEEGRV